MLDENGWQKAVNVCVSIRVQCIFNGNATVPSSPRKFGIVGFVEGRLKKRKTIGFTQEELVGRCLNRISVICEGSIAEFAATSM